MRKSKTIATHGDITVAKADKKIRQPFEAPGDVRDALLLIGEIISVTPGTILFEQGKLTNGVFLLLEGRVALSSGEDPVRVTRVAEKGSLLGLPATVCNKPYSLTAEAVTNIRACHVSVENFRNLLAKDTALGMTVVNMLAEEISVLRKLTVYKA